MLGVGTAEGKLYTIEHQKDGWKEPVLFGQHAEAVNGISWGPSTEPALLSVEPALSGKAELSSYGLPPKRLVSCSNDGTIVQWEFRESDQAERKEVGTH